MAKRVMVLALGVAAAITLGAAVAQLWLRWEQRSSAEPTDQNDPALTAEISDMEAYLADMVADRAEMESYLADLQLRASELRQQEADTLAAQQQRLEAVRAAEEQLARTRLDEQSAEQAARPQQLRETQPTTTTLHPKVQAEGEALVAAVVQRYEDSWPWVRAAWDVADLRFFDPKLPEPCKDSLACALGNKEVWFTLDALRLEPDIWSSASYEDVVLHELGHVWDDWLGGQQWPLMQAQFYEHYAGCHSRGRSNEDLRVELLVDALVIATRGIDTNTYRYSQGGYGYYDADGFGGCLVDGSAPPQHLVAAISAELFNCGSAKARAARQRLDMSVDLNDWDREMIAEQGTLRVSPFSFSWDREQGDLQALSLCHGIVCESFAAGVGVACEGWPGYQIDCTTTAVSKVIEEWESEQQLLWPSSWKLEALATCHGIVCEDRIGYVSARDCTVA